MVQALSKYKLGVGPPSDDLGITVVTDTFLHPFNLTYWLGGGQPKWKLWRLSCFGLWEYIHKMQYFIHKFGCSNFFSWWRLSFEPQPTTTNITVSKVYARDWITMSHQMFILGQPPQRSIGNKENVVSLRKHWFSSSFASCCYLVPCLLLRNGCGPIHLSQKLSKAFPGPGKRDFLCFRTYISNCAWGPCIYLHLVHYYDLSPTSNLRMPNAPYSQILCFWSTDMTSTSVYVALCISDR